jgi:hypothetical protein
MVHLPAVNTPQFDWCRTRLPGQPRPVPPVYEPEIAARAIVSVARRGQRQRILGGWNSLVVQGNKVMPGVFDHYAARTGWWSQQANGDEVGGRPGNLETAVDDAPGTARGARGRFVDHAHGMHDRQFVRSLGQVGRDVAASFRDRVRELSASSPS